MGNSFIYPIHDVGQGPYAVPEVAEEQFGEAAQLSGVASSADALPFWSFYEFMFRCHGDAVLNRFAEAAVSLGTAIEILLATVVRTAGPMIGEDPAKSQKVVEYPLRSLVEDHFTRYCHATVDLRSSANPFGRWWSEGYSLRNRVVHEGHRPAEPEFAAAYAAAVGLIQAIKHGLETQPHTKSFGESLRWDAASFVRT